MNTFTKIMLASALIVVNIYINVVWSAVDIYTTSDGQQVFILRNNVGEPWEQGGSFNTVITGPRVGEYK